MAFISLKSLFSIAIELSYRKKTVFRHQRWFKATKIKQEFIIAFFLSIPLRIAFFAKCVNFEKPLIGRAEKHKPESGAKVLYRSFWCGHDQWITLTIETHLAFLIWSLNECSINVSHHFGRRCSERMSRTQSTFHLIGGNRINYNNNINKLTH